MKENTEFATSAQLDAFSQLMDSLEKQLKTNEARLTAIEAMFAADALARDRERCLTDPRMWPADP